MSQSPGPSTPHVAARSRPPGSLPWIDFSLTLPNKVSMARDQLANERNWLTWFRLSCTLIVLGFTVLLQFRLPSGNKDPPQDNSSIEKPIGYVFIAIGLCSYFVGIFKYFRDQRRLAEECLEVQAGWASFIMIGIVFCFVCAVMIIASTNANVFNNGQ